MTGVSAKKIKCPDLLAWLKASNRIESALLQLGAIQGPDYDRYQESCMTLLLDPKCARATVGRLRRLWNLIMPTVYSSKRPAGLI
jgi:hypothetical protein